MTPRSILFLRVSAALLLLCVIASWIIVPHFIKQAYEKDTWDFLNKIIEGQAVHSVNFYLLLARELMTVPTLLIFGPIALLFFSSIRSLELRLQLALLLALYTFLMPAIFGYLTDGIFFYTNGHDEYTYLSYEFSQKVQGIKRLSSYIVTMLHEIGFSGGSINFIFDTISLTLLGVLIPKLVKEFFPKASIIDQYTAALIICFTPVLISSANPLLCKTIPAYIYADDLLRYFFVSACHEYPVFLRTPESQFSIVAGVLILWLLTKVSRTKWFFLFIPFMYFFVGILWASIGLIYYLSNLLSTKLPKAHLFTLVLISSVVSLILFGGLTGVVFRIFDVGGSAVFSHAPVFGVNQLFFILIVGISLFLLRNQNIEKNILLFMYSLLAATTIVYNLNAVGGIVIEPQHYELEIGVLFGVFAGIVYLTTKTRTPVFRITFTISYLTLIIALLTNTLIEEKKKVTYYLDQLQKLIAEPRFTASINSPVKRVAVNDIKLSYYISGLYLTKQGPLITSNEHIFHSDEFTWQAYNELKHCVNESDQNTRNSMESILKEYRYRLMYRYDNFLPLYQARREPKLYKYAELPINSDCSRYAIFILP